MGLTSLANAPSLAKPAAAELISSSRPTRSSSIDALFDDGLVGIDEESPLEEPLNLEPTAATPEVARPETPVGSIWYKSRPSRRASSEKDKPEETTAQAEEPTDAKSELENPWDENFFTGRWKESQKQSLQQKCEKEGSTDTLLNFTAPSIAVEQRSIKAKDDDWGEATDILLMLPDGSHAGGARGGTSASVQCTERRFHVQPKALETSFEFGEYQPSCLTGGGGRRTPTAGRRRSSPTNSMLSSGTDKDTEAAFVVDKVHQERKGSVVAAPTREVEPFYSKEMNQSARPARPTSQHQEPQRHVDFNLPPGFLEKETPRESLIQTLAVKGVVENERNQFLDELKHVKLENSQLKEDILRLEKEKLNIEKDLAEAQISSSSAICKQFSEEKEEAEKVVVRLSSEIQLLKSTCILADEKLSALRKIHQQEVNMLKHTHSRELEAKEKQLDSERAFLENQKHTTEALADLVAKSNEWCKKVQELQHSVVADRQIALKSTTDWLDSLERSAKEQESFMNECRKRSDVMQKQLEDITQKLSFGVKDIKDLHTTEKSYLLQERAHVQALQEALQVERVQSLAEVGATKQKLDEVREVYLQEKEMFLQKCFEERKELSAERDAILRMKEQLYHADASLEKQLLEHAARIQNETGELSKQRSELERARLIATEIAQEVEDGRRELEFRYKEIERQQRFCGSDDSNTDHEAKRHKQKLKWRKVERKRPVFTASDFSQSSTSPLFKMIQLDPWGKPRKKKSLVELPRFIRRSSKKKLSNMEAFACLQEQEQFIEEARRKLQVTKDFAEHLEE